MKALQSADSNGTELALLAQRLHITEAETEAKISKLIADVIASDGDYAFTADDFEIIQTSIYESRLSAIAKGIFMSRGMISHLRSTLDIITSDLYSPTGDFDLDFEQKLKQADLKLKAISTFSNIMKNLKANNKDKSAVSLSFNNIVATPNNNQTQTVKSINLSKLDMDDINLGRE